MKQTSHFVAREPDGRSSQKKCRRVNVGYVDIDELKDLRKAEDLLKHKGDPAHAFEQNGQLVH